MVLRLIYTLFIGVLLAVFVGVGISVFYAEPESPDYPSALKIKEPETMTEEVYLELKATQEAFDQQEQAFVSEMQTYNRNVSIMATIASVAILVISLTAVRHIMLIADGLLLGGVGTLLYGVVRGFGSDDDVFRFIVVSISLAVAIGLGYIKIIRPSTKFKSQFADI